MYNYTFLKDSSLLDGFKDLAEQHYDEVERKDEDTPFQLDIATLKALFEAKMLLVLIATDDRDDIVGYFAVVTSKDLHTSQIVAKEIGIYVRKDLRGSNICSEMFSRIEEELIKQDVFYICVIFKKDHNETLPIKLGYKVSEIVYEKVLK